MEDSQIWFRLVRFYIKIGLFFYAKKIRVVGKENIPKDGAVMFAVNHPNGLLDPLIVTTNNIRTSYFLVKAAAFKKPLVEKILNKLNLIAIYRMRDGIDQLAKNEEVFNTCFNILKNEETLVIFPEGTDCKDRTVRTLSKGFTRIVFGCLEKHPEVKIKVVPVGLTYQNVTSFPTKVALHYGKPIDANEIYENNIPSKSINILKKEVDNQLKNLSVHLPKDGNYEQNLSKLVNAQVDFTKVNTTNKIIKNNSFPSPTKSPINFAKPLLYLIKLNSIFPYLIWKNFSDKNTDKDFTDTLRFGYNIFLFPPFYSIQAIIIGLIFGSAVGWIYFFACFLSVFIYVKLASTPAK